MTNQFNYTNLERKLTPTEKEKEKRANGFDYVIASSALEGYQAPYFESLRDAYVEGYLTAADVSKLVDNHLNSCAS